METATAADSRPHIDEALARRLVDTQFPRWAGLPLKLLDPAGSDHVIYRLGEELSVRLPRHADATGQARKEARWLPRLAPHLPLAVPAPVAVGEPGCGYPWPWSVSRWLDGEVATVAALADSVTAAVELAEFLWALQRCTPEDGTDGEAGGTGPAGDAGASTDAGDDAGSAGDGLTGRPLSDRDRATRLAIARYDGVFDGAAMSGLWDAALHAPGWDRAPVWFHGDFHTGNLLTVGGRLSAVIDFGELGRGDPARDLMIAFTLMSARSRAVFREALGVDDATWLRGRGWALATGLNAHSAYAAVSPRVAAQTTRQITQALIG
ncbi:aminoglycoside phosphotransferase family protein [Streptomyces pactum]|uniref:Aminoglycoside phosphotransferase family protein n=1 Tax=Streptomyces pactum TaxID=68249 RepID=A0ABS0NES1_9ACTN|nr:aminoglycoside phosphotransferase family protein [Streptomyces pactum]MBH5333648.1 aminoglycoside phosphotransferase family protein [Streptomyces pactum]